MSKIPNSREGRVEVRDADDVDELVMSVGVPPFAWNSTPLDVMV